MHQHQLMLRTATHVRHAAAFPPAHPIRSWRRHMAFAGYATKSEHLWGYEGSAVQHMNLDTLKFMHRMSYGHRNRRSVLVVVYDPTDAACQQVEFEVERLASGLQHEPQVLIAGLNVKTAHSEAVGPESTRMFLQGSLGVTQLPTILLYPEGTPGFMRYQGDLTADALLASLNRCQSKVLPDRAQLQLQGPMQGSINTTATTSNPTQPNINSDAATSQSPQVSQAAPHTASQAMMQPHNQSSTWAKHGYWTAGKAWFWGGILAASVAMLVWERWLGPKLEERAFAARQAARQAGKADVFDEDTNLDDLFRLRMSQKDQQSQ